MILKRRLPGGEYDFHVHFETFFPDFSNDKAYFYLFSLEVQVPGGRVRKMDLYKSLKCRNNEEGNFLRIAHNFSSSTGTSGGLTYGRIIEIDRKCLDIPDIRREAYRVGMEFLEGKIQELPVLWRSV